MKKEFGLVAVLVVCCLVSGVWCLAAEKEKGLVGWWKFDEGDGEVARTLQERDMTARLRVPGGWTANPERRFYLTGTAASRFLMPEI